MTTGSIRMLRVHPDAILRWDGDSMILSNPRSKCHVELNSDAISAMARLGNGASIKHWIKTFDNVQGWNRTEHSGARGLVYDHSGLSRTRGLTVLGKELIDMLERYFLLETIGKDALYDKYLGPKKNLLDRQHLGSFHQVVGQYQSIVKRNKNKWKAWYDQKFLPDGEDICPGPYKFVQKKFISDYFSDINLVDKKFLDFGCGNGFYSKIFSKAGAYVTGIDTSSKLLELAKKNNSTERIEFILANDTKSVIPVLKKLKSNSFDVIYISDVILLLFNKEENSKEIEQLDKLLTTLCQLLKPGGKLYSMEPNPIFWHASRIENSSRASAIITEYRHKRFNVMPTYDEVIGRFVTSGLLLSEFHHAYNDTKKVEADPNESYTSEYPIWDFLVYEKH